MTQLVVPLPSSTLPRRAVSSQTLSWRWLLGFRTDHAAPEHRGAGVTLEADGPAEVLVGFLPRVLS
ncbi:hypothetical protein ABZV60_31510 [Streptomyces sp. NPDC004787]|uniref:hypothetical protein n=1 Tax=Streptomyces sp. NPDC004787 TaxID=3154291 RepID=UPI00339E4EC2